MMDIMRICPCMYCIFSYDMKGIPAGEGFRLAYFSCIHICFASRPVSISGDSLPSAFHTESSGKGRSFTMIHDMVPSLEISLLASSGFE